MVEQPPVKESSGLAVTRQGQGRPLLLVHGFTGCARDWSYVFDEAPKGYETLAVDLPGHGRSFDENLPHFRFDEAARRLAMTLDAMGLAGIEAIGLSGGALTLLHLGLERPDLVCRQVLVSATPHFAPQSRALMALVDPDTQPDSEWELMRQRHPGGDAQIRRLWNWSRALAESHGDVEFSPHRLQRLETPTLLVHGDQDPLYATALALQLHRGLADSRLWVVPGGGHGPIFGPDAPEFRRRALEFLGEGVRTKTAV